MSLDEPGRVPVGFRPGATSGWTGTPMAASIGPTRTRPCCAGEEPALTTSHFRLPRRLLRREDYLLAHCVGQRVLHVGCVDFSTTGDWFQGVVGGTWLHGRLEAVAAELVGVDNATAAIGWLRAQCGRSDVHLADAQTLELPGVAPFDVIVAAELIEHLPSPGAFLTAARPLLKSAGLLLVTTTNAYCLRRLLRVATGVESVHEDHVAYYSHRTLARLAELSGYAVVEQLNYRLPNRRPLLPYLVEALACTVSANLGEGIIAALRLPATPPPPAPCR